MQWIRLNQKTTECHKRLHEYECIKDKQKNVHDSKAKKKRENVGPRIKHTTSGAGQHNACSSSSSGGPIFHPFQL